MAPTLSFTAEEAWAVLSGKQDESVFEQQWYELPVWSTKDIHVWQDIRAVREQVNKKLEELRAAGAIGSALQAEVDMFVGRKIYELLSRLEDDLRLVFITSRATVHLCKEGEEEIRITPSTHKKCDRCWHYREEVCSNAEHSTLCGRCVSNLYGSGEARRYA